MGSWLQEAVEIYSKEYKVKETTFDVNGWRMLLDAVIEYVENYDMLEREVFFKGNRDEFGIKALERIEEDCKEMQSMVRFVKSIRPPDRYLYFNSDNLAKEPCEEMQEALDEDTAIVEAEFSSSFKTSSVEV